MAWNFPAPAPLAPFGCWPYTMVIPKFYWDAESPEQRVKALCMLYDKLMAYVDALKDAVNVDSEAIKELQDAFQKFMESGFDDYYAEQIHQWVIDNMPGIIADSVKMVFFGLTRDGHFCAYIPESWSDIVFDTGAVYGTEEYGRLILSYNVNGVEWDDSTGNGNLPYLSELESRVETLEKQMRNNNRTLYTGLAPDARISLPPTGKRIENPLG